MASVDTPRLLLRLPERADVQALQDIHQDPEAIELKQVTLLEAPGGIDLGLRNIERMHRHWRRCGYGQWAVVEKATNQVIGCVGFFHPEGWLGVDLNWIIERSRRGNGFATEAAAAALEWAWQNTQITHVISLIGPTDARSARIATKIGESFERADVDPINGEPIHV